MLLKKDQDFLKTYFKVMSFPKFFIDFGPRPQFRKLGQLSIHLYINKFGAKEQNMRAKDQNPRKISMKSKNGRGLRNNEFIKQC